MHLEEQKATQDMTDCQMENNILGVSLRLEIIVCNSTLKC